MKKHSVFVFVCICIFFLTAFAVPNLGKKPTPTPVPTQTPEPYPPVEVWGETFEVLAEEPYPAPSTPTVVDGCSLVFLKDGTEPFDYMGDWELVYGTYQTPRVIGLHEMREGYYVNNPRIGIIWVYFDIYGVKYSSAEKLVVKLTSLYGGDPVYREVDYTTVSSGKSIWFLINNLGSYIVEFSMYSATNNSFVNLDNVMLVECETNWKIFLTSVFR